MAKLIDIKNKQPKKGQKVVVLGIWNGEVTGAGKEPSYGLVEFSSEDHSCVEGTEFYAAWYSNITHWINLGI